MKEQTFEHFYYERVAVSESCGCAEQVINVRDLDAFAASSRQGTTIAGWLAAVAGLLRGRRTAEASAARAAVRTCCGPRNG